MSNTKFDLAMSILKLTKSDVFVKRELEFGATELRQLLPASEYQCVVDAVASENTFNRIMTRLAEELSNSSLHVLEELHKFYNSATYELIQAVMAPMQRNMFKIVQDIAFDVSTKVLTEANFSLYNKSVVMN